jgi:hypothetical protein
MKRSTVASGLLAVAALTMGAKGCGGKDTAAYPAFGSISGTLEAVGGPPRPTGSSAAGRPLPGQVTVTGAGHTYAVVVGQTGQYSLSVPPGTYTITARSPLYQSGAADCRAQNPATVAADRNVQADVACQES